MVRQTEKLTTILHSPTMAEQYDIYKSQLHLGINTAMTQESSLTIVRSSQAYYRVQSSQYCPRDISTD